MPITLVVVGLLAWAVLAGLPFGGRDRSVVRPAREVARVSEGSASTTTVREIGIAGDEPDRPTPPPSPSIIENRPNPLPSSREPAFREPREIRTEVINPDRAPRTAPGPGRREGREMSEGSALDRLDSFLAARNPYRVASDCYATRSLGYKNRGYTIEVVSRSCAENPTATRSLGRWRVDTLTGEIFRENRAGRFVRP